MKRFARWAMALGLCLALSVCGALAAESDITVQLDGQPLTFTDAVPQVKDQRTYLPFRAVFEAMGAEVDNEGSVITAVRGDKTLTMTLNSTEASVTTGGVTLPLQMDVVPYVDGTSWRTYVPVRFAAQAFDCVVGWDQANSTAIIIDAEKLAADAMAGKSFTYLEKMVAMSDKYKEGIWDMDAALDIDATMFAMTLTTMKGTVNGVMQDDTKLELDMDMTADFSGSLGMLGMMDPNSVSTEEQAVFDILAKDGIQMSVRGDLNTGKLYMNMDMSALASIANDVPDANTWYELDMAALMAQAGMDWSSLMAMSENSDLLDRLVTSLSAAEPTDSTTAYAELKKTFDDFFATFADQSFVRKDHTLVTAYTQLEDGINAIVTLTLTTDNDTITGYLLSVDANETQGAQNVTISMSTGMDAHGKMNAQVDMGINQFATINMILDGSCTPGTTAPVVTPPDGATIVPFTDLMGQSGDLGVIGGADGPTSVWVG